MGSLSGRNNHSSYPSIHQKVDSSSSSASSSLSSSASSSASSSLSSSASASASSSSSSSSSASASASHNRLLEGITVLLSRWDGLQMAVQNQWGGHDSYQKSQQLAADVFSWFFHSKAHRIEDLENLLHESMLLSLNTEIEDGSIEEVAEQLMVLHEEYLHGNH